MRANLKHTVLIAPGILSRLVDFFGIWRYLMENESYLDLEQLAIRGGRLLTGKYVQPTGRKPIKVNTDVCKRCIREYLKMHKKLYGVKITMKEYLAGI